ncbi:MAG: amidohydrolase family protein, partial [Gemmatimonadetes bacterium]|nr:amidohydrolase family protein [Gemmatimonadota bacterium]
MMRRSALALILPFLLALPPSTAPAQQPYDLLVRGGRVLDGTGAPWVRADVAITGDRIVAVGRLPDAAARRVIDASGLRVAPGFIDVHSHAGSALSDSTLAGAWPLLAQGITTIVVNPDGGGPVDLTKQRAAIEARRPGVNVVPLIGHGAVRRDVLAMEDRAPTAVELARMQALVRAAMEQGAFGLSSGLYYAPGSYAQTEEVIELAKVAA